MLSQLQDRDDVIAWIAQRFETCGAALYLGEAVTVAEHMLQCAALAAAEGAPDILIAAALLHDIGHLTGNAADATGTDPANFEHELIGARLLEPHFPPMLTACVRLHVAAKRYLCATDQCYAETLSPASRQSLTLQGGPMNTSECSLFEAIESHRHVVQVRRWDDCGKSVGRTTASFRDFQPLLERLVMKRL